VEEQGEQDELISVEKHQTAYINMLFATEIESKKSSFQKLGYLLNEKQRLMLSRSSTMSQTHPPNGTKFHGKGLFLFYSSW
jgi:hypothetical protein